VILLVFGVNAAETVLTVPNIRAPLAVGEVIAPINVIAIVNITAKAASIAVLRCVADRSAVA
jgi:hypothetical protein